MKENTNVSFHANVITLRHAPPDLRPPIIDKTLTVDLFERLRMQPYPVLLMNAPRGAKWGGFCADANYTEAGEIVLDMRFVSDLNADNPRHASRLLSTYLHECAHRLTPGHSHNSAFAAMCLLLYLRAGDVDGRPLYQTFDLYDIQDEFGRTHGALDWAWKQANNLAETDSSAEECAQTIMQRYDQWQCWLAGAPERENERRLRKTQLATRWRNLQERLAFWKRVSFTAIFLVAFTMYAFSAHAATPQILQTQATSAAVEAEIEAQKATTFVWVCDCIAGQSVWSLKSLKQIEREVQAKQAAAERLMAAPQRITLPGGSTYQAPALDRTTAFSIVSICK